MSDGPPVPRCLRTALGALALALAVLGASMTALPAAPGAPTAPPAPITLHSPHDVIEALAISPDYAADGTLYAGLPRFNLLLRSRDAGRSWQTANTGLDTAYVLSLAVSPDHATDDTLWCAEIAGLFRSVDRGAHWQELELPEGMRQVTSVHASPDWARDRTLVAVTQRDGVWLGRARGTDWVRVDARTPGTPAPVTLARDEGGELLLWGLDGGRLLRARVGRGEDAWTVVAEAGALPVAQATTLAVDGDGPEPVALYAGTARGVLRSADAGRSWSRERLPGGDDEVLHLALARDAGGRALLWASTATHGIAARGGDGSWTASREGFREPTHQTERHWLATLPSPDYATDHTVYAAAFEGLYLSRDGGATWRWLNLLHAALIRNLAFSPQYAEDGGLWIQTYGAGLMASTDGGAGFRRVETMDWWFPDGIAVSPDYPQDRTLLIGTPNRLLISRDGGESVQLALADKGFARVLAFAPDWAASGTAYAHLSTDTGLGTNRFVYTSDRGATWRDSSLRTVYDMAFATGFSDSGRMWAGTPDGLFRSDDRGATFTRVESLQAAGINSVSLAPGAPGADAARGPDALIVVSRGSGVFLSDDDGATWRRPEHGLEGVRVSLVELSPAYAEDGLAFAGPMNAGVHRSRDGGRTWERVPGGPSIALSMALSPDFARDGTLLVGAYDGPWLGRGAGSLWQRLELPLPEGDGSAVSREPGDPGAGETDRDGGTRPGAPGDRTGDGPPRPPEGGGDGHDAGTADDAANGGSSLVGILGTGLAVVVAFAALLASRRRALR